MALYQQMNDISEADGEIVSENGKSVGTPVAAEKRFWRNAGTGDSALDTGNDGPEMKSLRARGQMKRAPNP